MLGYLVRRLLWVPPVLIIVTAVVFTMARIGPGDPISIAAGQFRDPEVLERVKRERGLDKPIYEQYVIYMGDVLRGNLGESYRYAGLSVEEVYFPALWRSMQFNAIALAITLGIGLPAGVYAARRQGTWVDPASISAFLFFQSIPGLVSVPFLIVFLALRVDILPANGWPQDCVTLGFLPADYQCIGVLSTEAFIPLIALSLPGIAFWARFTRATTLTVLGEDYVRTARAKGINEFGVLTNHVMRNALLPLSTLIGFSLLSLLEGSFFIENLSGIPGVGKLALEAVTGRDYDMIMAIVIVGAVGFVLISILVDVAYTLIDPRIRYDAHR
jgi:peptide/nickel transport system permease protein